jgi:NADH-quinone oxidoreductase subunit N
VLASVVSAYYYVRIIKLMYFDEPTEALDSDFGREIRVVVLVSAVLVLLFFLYPDPLLAAAEAAAASLFGG